MEQANLHHLHFVDATDQLEHPPEASKPDFLPLNNRGMYEPLQELFSQVQPATVVTMLSSARPP